MCYDLLRNHGFTADGESDMAKRMILFLLAFALMVPYAACAGEPTKVYYNEEVIAELDLRFYDETPNIPYLGMKEYAQLMMDMSLSVYENEDGTYTVENPNGAKLVCDPQQGTIFAEDWHAFLAQPLPLEDRALGLKDTGVHFARITDVVYEGEPDPVTIDLAKYGISFYSDGNDVYLPVSTLSNLLTDLATNQLVYNGENLYKRNYEQESFGEDGLVDSEVIRNQILGEDRPDDVIRQCYADLCLSMDYLYGHPGRVLLDGPIAEKGLDRALGDLGEEGAAIKEGLLSPKLADYIDAMLKLFFNYLDDGHSLFTSGVILVSVPEIVEALGLESTLYDYLLDSALTFQMVMNELIPAQRSFIWGEDSYREYGSTAIIRLDSFMPDTEAWDSYYKGEGELPQDDLGIVVSGLKKASENPEIRNVVFDLSGNGGGSPDVVMAIMALTFGQYQVYGENVITGQPMKVTFEIDTNFDGVFDEKDKKVKYDFNYGVLMTKHAFSAGNLFPFIMQEAGAVLIGEPSSGGSCSIQLCSDAEGFSYMISSGQWKLTDARGDNLEDGCRIDVPISRDGTIPISDLIDDPYAEMIAYLIGEDTDVPSYKNFFDDEWLDEIMNDWFGKEEQPDPVTLFFYVLSGDGSMVLPNTGSSFRHPAALSVRSDDLICQDLPLHLQIPRFGIETDLAAMPLNGNSWAAEWLDDRAGVMEGSSLPGEGISLIAGHNTLNDTEYGPFARLYDLEADDSIFVRNDDGELLRYRVYANELVAPDDFGTLADLAVPDALILITCENESTDGTYLNRRVVAARPVDR